jgi:hypothetical protein
VAQGEAGQEEGDQVHTVQNRGSQCTQGGEGAQAAQGEAG